MFRIFILCVIFTNIVYALPTKYLFPNEVVLFDAQGAIDEPLNIYCYKGKPKSVIYLWQTIFLYIESRNDDYIQYDGASPEEVMKEYEAHRSSWRLNLFSWKSKNMKLDPFNQSCIGIESYYPYKIKLKVTHVDYWKILMLVIGVSIFLLANRLCQNVFFYYLCGVSVGVFASFAILIYFIGKLFPRKSIMVGMFATGWTVSLYLINLIKDNLRLILENYLQYVFYYTIVSGVISFIVCYRMGPIINERTRNLLKWFLQSIGLFLIFSSSQHQEAAVVQMALLLIFQNIPTNLIVKSKMYYKRKFPSKVKLLSNDEYYQQGVIETSKNLEELRKYCLSPECKQWKTVLKLKDVKRFASFIEGNSHLSDDEILEHETSSLPLELTDDERYTDDES